MLIRCARGGSALRPVSRWLRSPASALSAIRDVLRGELLCVDAISLRLSLLHPSRPLARLEAHGWPLWWVPISRPFTISSQQPVSEYWTPAVHFS